MLPPDISPPRRGREGRRAGGEKKEGEEEGDEEDEEEQEGEKKEKEKKRLCQRLFTSGFEPETFCGLTKRPGAVRC